LLPNEQGRIVNTVIVYDVSVPYLEKCYGFTDRNVLKHLSAVDMEDVNFPKCEQAMTVLSFNHIFAFDVYDFYEEFCKCKGFIVEMGNGNILDDVGQKWLHVFRIFYAMKEVINMFKLASYSLSILGSALSLKVHFL
jgi:hypothetical protein